MSENQNKKEVTVLYRNFTPEIASDIIKLNLSEEAEKTLYGYLASGSDYAGNWWTRLWVDKTLYTEWSQETSKKIAAFQNCPKEAMVVYTDAAFLKLLGKSPSPEEMIEQGLKDLKRYKYYIDNIKEVINEINRQHLEPWRIKPDNP